jgi:hypothetical protein
MTGAFYCSLAMQDRVSAGRFFSGPSGIEINNFEKGDDLHVTMVESRDATILLQETAAAH